MKGKKVEVTLHTPILIEVGEDATRKTDAVAKIRANVSDTSEGGLLLEIQEIRNERGHKLTSPAASLFLPFHKIDHIFFD